MLKPGNRHARLACLAPLLILYCSWSQADSFLCAAEQASGFVYDVESGAWEAATISIEDKKYLVSPADVKNVFVKALKYDYAVRKLDSPQPIIHCKAVKLNDSNEETGLVTCRGNLGASFSFDKRSGRFIRTQPAGYVGLAGAGIFRPPGVVRFPPARE